MTMIKTLIRVTRPLRYALEELVYSDDDFQKLLDLRGRLESDKFLIVGNGPSLNKTPLDLFTGIPSIGMNKIDLIFNRVRWRPSCIVVENDLVVKQHWKYLVESDIPTLISWKARHAIPRRNRGHFIFFLNRRGHEFSNDQRKGFGTSGTVTYSALQLAYFFGAELSVLVGVDHSFSNIEKSKPLDYEKRRGLDTNHFDPNYFQENSFWGVPDLDLSEKGYKIARQAYEMADRRIIDATVGGNLTIFEKATIEQAHLRLAMDNEIDCSY